jgi:hypothetical protein
VQRLLRQLLEKLSSRVGSATPWGCQDWGNTEAACRFFGNDRISEANILAGHFASTRERFVSSESDRVLSRLTDIELGIMIGVQLVGN